MFSQLFKVLYFLTTVCLSFIKSGAEQTEENWREGDMMRGIQRGETETLQITENRTKTVR